MRWVAQDPWVVLRMLATVPTITPLSERSVGCKAVQPGRPRVDVGVTSAGRPRIADNGSYTASGGRCPACAQPSRGRSVSGGWVNLTTDTRAVSDESSRSHRMPGRTGLGRD